MTMQKDPTNGYDSAANRQHLRSRLELQKKAHKNKKTLLKMVILTAILVVLALMTVSDGKQQSPPPNGEETHNS